MNDQDGSLNFTAGLDNSKLAADAAKAKALLKGIGDTGKEQGSVMQDAFSKASSYAGVMAAGAVASIGMLGKQILDTTAKFEKFGIVLKNTLGDTKGADALNMIANFAATTPFQLDEVTGAFIKMANQGFVPTQKEMVKLGDLASSTGKSFDQLGEAILDAQTGEFERLKEFGIKASNNGDRVTFSFKEQKTTVENTSKAIQGYILSLGDLKGVAGANEKISASLTGQMSNLGDKMAAMYNEIGTANKGILYAAVGATSTLIENYKAVGEAVGVLVSIYGVYKVATMAVAYADNLRVAAFARNRAIMVEYQALMATQNILEIQAGGRKAILAAQEEALALAKNNVAVAEARVGAASKASSLANPYVLAAMAVAALAYGLYKLYNYQTDLEKVTQKAGVEIDIEKNKAAQLFAELKNAAEGTDDWKRAKQGILDQYGNYLTEQQKELNNTNLIADAYARVGEEIEKTISIKVRNEAIAAVDLEYSEPIKDYKTAITKKINTSFDRETAADYNQKFGTKLDLVQYELDPVKKEKYKAELDALIQEMRTKIYKDNKWSSSKDMSDISYAYDALMGRVNKSEIAKKAVNDAFKNQLDESAANKKDPILTTYEAALKVIKDKKIIAEKELADLKTNNYVKLQAAKKAEIAALEASAPTTKGKKELDALNAKIDKAKNELAIIQTKGADPIKAVTAQQGVVDVWEKQLGETVKAESESAKERKKIGADLLDFFEKSENDIVISQKNTRDKNVSDDIKAEDDEIKRNEENQKVLDQIYADGVEAAHRVDDDATKRKEDKDKKDKAARQKKVDDELQRQRDLSQGFFDIADSAGYLSQQIGESNKGLADMLKGVANVAGQMGNLVDKGAFTKATFDSNGKQLTGMSKADAVSSVISGATQMMGMFIGQAAENKRVMEDYYAAVIKQQNDYNLSLNEQIRLNTEIKGSIFFDDFKAKMSDASKALKDATDKKNEAMAKFYGSEAIVGKKNVVSGANVLGGVGVGAAIGIGAALGTAILPGVGTAVFAGVGALVGGIAGLFAKKKKDIVAPLLETYPLLIKANGDFDASLAKTLIGTANVTKETSAILQNIIDWEDAAKAANDQITAVITDMVGSIGSDLKNALVDAFEQGTDAAVKFGEAVNSILEDIISQAVFNAIFGPALDNLQTSLKDNAKNGGDLVTPIRQFLTLVPGLTGLFNSTMATTKDDTGKTTTSTRNMTDAEKGQQTAINKQIAAQQKIINDNNANAEETGKGLRAFQVTQNNNASAEITRLNGLLGALSSSLIVTTPGIGLFNDPATVAERTGSSKGITSMSQDSADEMNGRLTAMQGHTFRIADGIDIMKANSASILSNVIEIKGHTLSMQSDMKAVKAGIDTINRQGITLKN